MPGAFETRFQTAPLDLNEDTFYYAREETIERRLEELANGKAKDIIAAVDEREREKSTMCVGVRWELFSREDLLEIVEVRSMLTSS